MLLVTLVVSVILSIHTLVAVSEFGGDAFAFEDGGSDRNDIHTLAYEAVRQAQSVHGARWRSKSNDGDGGGGPDFCSRIREEAGYDDRSEKGRRRQLATAATVEPAEPSDDHPLIKVRPRTRTLRTLGLFP